MKNALIILFFCFLIFWWVKGCFNKQAVEENNAVVKVENGKIDSIYLSIDSLRKTDSAISKRLDTAHQLSTEAKAEAIKAQSNLSIVKQQSEKSFKSIERNSNEILKKLNAAPDVRAIDDIFDSIERARATKMLQN